MPKIKYISLPSYISGSLAWFQALSQVNRSLKVSGHRNLTIITFQAYKSTLGLLTHWSVRIMLLYPIWSLSRVLGVFIYIFEYWPESLNFFTLFNCLKLFSPDHSKWRTWRKVRTLWSLGSGSLDDGNSGQNINHPQII